MITNTASNCRRVLFSILVTGGSCLAGAFVNLGFDKPQLENLRVDPDNQIQYGTPTDLVPGWSITQDLLPVQRVWYYGRGSLIPITLSGDATANNCLVGDRGSPIGQSAKSTQFSQMGKIPEWAVTLEFMWTGRTFGFDSPLRINGEEIIAHEVPDRGHDYTADMSLWAGRDVTLSFEFPVGNDGILDNIRFTVPEPSMWALLGVGGAGLGWLVLRGRKPGKLRDES